MSNFANPQSDVNVLRMVLASGTAALPSVVFANDLTKGLSWTTSGLRLSGLAAPTNNDDAANKAYVDGISPSPSFPLLAPNGSAGAPSFSFSAHPTTGIYGTGSDSLLFAAGGALVANINDGGLSITGVGTQLLVVNGDASTPPIAFASDSTTGLYSGGSSVNVTVGGNDAASWDTGAGAGETYMLLWDIDTDQMLRVSVGANDSGGTGFKLLRIPNS